MKQPENIYWSFFFFFCKCRLVPSAVSFHLSELGLCDAGELKMKVLIKPQSLYSCFLFFELCVLVFTP